MDGANVDAVAFTTGAAGLAWEVSAVADFTGDGKADVRWREIPSGSSYLWEMDGASVGGGSGFTAPQADPTWQARHPR
jgi:hypothetical protein